MNKIKFPEMMTTSHKCGHKVDDNGNRFLNELKEM